MINKLLGAIQVGTGVAGIANSILNFVSVYSGIIIFTVFAITTVWKFARFFKKALEEKTIFPTKLK